MGSINGFGETRTAIVMSQPIRLRAIGAPADAVNQTDVQSADNVD